MNLNAHQLIKVRVAGDDREARIAMLETICESLSCAQVHHLGKTLIIYRPDLEAQKAQVEATNATRAVRKPSEPHTPKKQAAEGVTRTRRTEKTRRAAEKADQPDTSAAPRARKARTASTDRPAHGIPRRSTSALSLRAGARRGIARSGKR